VPTREQVVRLLESGLDYTAIGERLGVPAGQAYMIATGLPADGSDAVTAEEQHRPGLLKTSTQHLVSPQPESPTASDTVKAWLKQRTSGDEQMRRAARRLEAAPGEAQQEEGVRDVTDLLTREHNRITSLSKQLQAIPGRKKSGSPAQMSRRGSIAGMIADAVSRHVPPEREYLWPAVREILEDGGTLANQGLEQEREMTQTLTALGKVPPESEEFDTLVDELVERLRKHIAFQEMVFARLREAMPQGGRDRLGEMVRRAQQAEEQPADCEGTARGKR
jgi:hypothetical protein